MQTQFRKEAVLIVLLIIGLTGSGFMEAPMVDDWQRLGSRKVNYLLDRDVIKVTRNEGTFTKLKIKVTGGSLNMHRIIVHYGNGTRDVLLVKENFRRGGRTRVLDLRGNQRVIRDVIFYYDTKDRSRRRATVHLYAR
ncbi:hypothetical protein [Croceiramulus getboli]|nr:hypothetical protein P8624_10720 [Flavobacteriaceae bacterium YJPT1-3]